MDEAVIVVYEPEPDQAGPKAAVDFGDVRQDLRKPKKDKKEKISDEERLKKREEERKAKEYDSDYSCNEEGEPRERKVIESGKSVTFSGADPERDLPLPDIGPPPMRKFRQIGTFSYPEHPLTATKRLPMWACVGGNFHPVPGRQRLSWDEGFFQIYGNGTMLF